MDTSLTLRRAGLSVGLLLVLVSMLCIIISEDALAARNIPLMIQTVPKSPGTHFSLNGEEFVADEHGIALITVPEPGTYRLRFLPDTPSHTENRLQFAMWSDAERSSVRRIEIAAFTYLEAGFETSQLITFEFSDSSGAALAPGRIDSMMLTDPGGKSIRLKGPGPHHLVSSSPILNGTSLELEKSDYRIKEIVVGGRDVLPQDVGLNPLVDTQPSIQLSISNSLAVPESTPRNWNTVLWVVVAVFIAAGAVVLATTKAY